MTQEYKKHFQSLEFRVFQEFSRLKFNTFYATNFRSKTLNKKSNIYSYGKSEKLWRFFKFSELIKLSNFKRSLKKLFTLLHVIHASIPYLQCNTRSFSVVLSCLLKFYRCCGYFCWSSEFSIYINSIEIFNLITWNKQNIHFVIRMIYFCNENLKRNQLFLIIFRIRESIRCIERLFCVHFILRPTQLIELTRNIDDITTSNIEISPCM